MPNVIEASPAGHKRASALGWVSTLALGVVAVFIVWIAVGAGPDICGFAFADSQNCFAVDRERIGWTATAAILMGAGIFAIGALLARPSWLRRSAWVAASVLMIATVAITLSVLA